MSDEQGEWTFSRVLALMDEQAKTGILEIGVPSTGTTTHIHLRKGYVVDVEEVVGEHRWILGDYLLLSETVDNRTLLAAEKEAKKKGLTIEEVLVSNKAISPDILKRFVDLQMTELLMPLFQEEGLTINFLDERPRANVHATDLPVSYLLKEAERQTEHWVPLQQEVGRVSAVYLADPSVMAEVLGYDDPDHDEEDEDDEERLLIPEVGMNTRIVYFFTNGAKTVGQVARASGLSLYDTYYAYAELLRYDLVELVTPHSKGEELGSAREHLSRLVGLITYVIIAALLGLAGQWLVTHAHTLSPSTTASTPAIDEAVQTATFELIEGALQLYALRHGSFPEDPGALVTSHLLRPRVMATLAKLDYSSNGTSYTLAWSE